MMHLRFRRYCRRASQLGVVTVMRPWTGSSHTVCLCLYRTLTASLENWRTKRIIERQRADEVILMLSSRQTQVTETSVAFAFASPHARLPRVGPAMHTMRVSRAERSSSRSKKTANEITTMATTHPTPMPLWQARVLLLGPGYTAYALATFFPLSESENAELGFDIEFENE